jgi:hypothetical protein
MVSTPPGPFERCAPASADRDALDGLPAVIA